MDLKVKVSINLTQSAVYSDLIKSVELITDNTTLPVKGPLLGILSAHIAYPTEDIFAFACDMPQMDSFLLKELYDQSFKHKADAFIYTNEGEAEPLCAIYSAAGLQQIITMMKQGELKKFSMKFILDHLTLFTIPVEEHNKKYFQNYNAHADFNGQPHPQPLSKGEES
ncbi:molybdenum cofactor guanylyltransferase [Niabella ginsengisoli]|uniref:NTP transferase domain-containing protein n=1 Tax=Niabella ginsengisoli TaxID=522298 RepID=A0ABS9SJL5_9BACT|nr:NTP transferase domain-containing protein [Niabella ginsengisoli]MCH5598554.1 NTP transferase domain-containing protein [Niabella ginsengisoli]